MRHGAVLRELGTDPGILSLGIDLLHLLPRSADRHVVVHGDFNPGNVLAARRAPFLAIDPKPMVGDPAYDPWSLVAQLDWPFRLPDAGARRPGAHPPARGAARPARGTDRCLGYRARRPGRPVGGIAGKHWPRSEMDSLGGNHRGDAGLTASGSSVGRCLPSSVRLGAPEVPFRAGATETPHRTTASVNCLSRPNNGDECAAPISAPTATAIGPTSRFPPWMLAWRVPGYRARTRAHRVVPIAPRSVRHKKSSRQERCSGPRPVQKGSTE